MCDRCKSGNATTNDFPLTTKAEQEEISIHSDTNDEIHFRKVAGKIEVELDGKKILISAQALLCAARVICGDRNEN